MTTNAVAQAETNKEIGRNGKRAERTARPNTKKGSLKVEKNPTKPDATSMARAANAQARPRPEAKVVMKRIIKAIVLRLASVATCCARPALRLDVKIIKGVKMIAMIA